MKILKLFFVIFISLLVPQIKAESKSANELLSESDVFIQSCSWWNQAQCVSRSVPLLKSITNLKINSSVEEIKQVLLAALTLVNDCWNCFVDDNIQKAICSGINKLITLLAKLGVDTPLPSECASVAIGTLMEVFPDGSTSMSNEVSQREVTAKGSSRSFTPFGVPTDNFIDTISQSILKGNEINDGVQSLKKSIDDITNVLGTPKEVYKNADELYDALDALQSILKSVGYVPGVKGVTKSLSSTVKRLKESVKKAKKSLQRLKSRTEPLKKKTVRLGGTVDKVRRSIQTSISLELSIHDTVKKLDQNLPPQHETTLDQKTGRVTSSFVSFNDLQDDILNEIESTEDETEDVRNALSALSDIADDIVEITDLLGPTMGPLIDIKRALDKKVCVNLGWPLGKHCMSVNDAINNPVSSLFNKALDAVLDPLIGNIKIPGIPFDIPGLDKIDIAIEEVNKFDSIVDSSINSFSGFDSLLLDINSDFEKFERDIKACC